MRHLAAHAQRPTTPRWTRQSSFSSGSQMMAASSSRPTAQGDEVAGAEHPVFLVHERAHHELPRGLHAGATKGGRGHHGGVCSPPFMSAAPRP